MQEKKHFKNQTLLKNTTNYKGKSVEFAINAIITYTRMNVT